MKAGTRNEYEKVAVIGCGAMGGQIVLNAAKSAFPKNGNALSLFNSCKVAET